MHHCTVCKKAFATIHILDLRDGVIVEQRHLCAKCAEGAAGVQQKVPPLKLQQSEMLELISTLHNPEHGNRRTDAMVRCPGCQLTAAEFRVRGRLGCPRCYEVFRASLLPLLERVHDGTSHRGRCPGRLDQDARVSMEEDADLREQLAELRQQLASAVAAEDYEAAAHLRDRIRSVETGEQE